MPVAATDIEPGVFVKATSGVQGRVDLIATSGIALDNQAPIEASPEDPAARVSVWSTPPSGAWRPIGRMALFRAAALQPVEPPFTGTLGTGTGTGTALLTRYMEYLEHAQSAGLPDYCSPTAATVREVFERGYDAAAHWHPAGAADPAEGGMRRVEAFLWLASGRLYEGRLIDTDLLPGGHPLQR